VLVLKVLGRLRFSFILADFQLFVYRYILVWLFKATRQDGKEIKIFKVLEFITIKVIEEVKVNTKMTKFT
jgi:hypothetical protein